MKIIEYEYKDSQAPSWSFNNVFPSNVNLLVGDTATGKSRFLNTIFNLGEFVKGKRPVSGQWKLTFEHKDKIYKWELISDRVGELSNKKVIIKQEDVWVKNGSKFESLIKRNSESFLFGKSKMPKLSQSETAIGLLKEDEAIKPLYEAFSSIRHRRFSVDGANKVSQIDSINPKQFFPKNRTEKQILKELFDLDLGVSSTMFFIKKYSYTIFKKIVIAYRRFFPFIEDITVGDFSDIQSEVRLPGKSPVLFIREVGQKTSFAIVDMSSGMQKVFQILLDTYLLPDEGVYLIDEYENSLGVGAIDFFPEFILELDKDIQFFITSHHPYLINKIPVKDWFVFHRDGVNVQIQYGDALINKYGKSKQQAFIQLLNDPFYSRSL